ncbi:hypothetical protein O6H91_14G064900 [Diphasiastrum complanatum]|uniref:Uncharacterized protein n=1 Tax=Diphasiastrum complanatum TaxID=34168 RepID=A0ACC2BQ85_DIPCM|nr:hypothetical protein O6H91_14G064900 [Diphasiastrum complanatum]
MAASMSLCWMRLPPPPLLCAENTTSSWSWTICTTSVKSTVSSLHANQSLLIKAREFARIFSVASFTAALLLEGTSQAALARVQERTGNICVLAAESRERDGLGFEDELGFPDGPPQAMQGMTAKNFDPSRYSGRWFEVASLKRGFAGQGQEDCHCTQGVYQYDEKNNAIQVDTFCVHGSPTGYITGIRGKVQCIKDVGRVEPDLERPEDIKEKCYLRFPTLPFIPKEPYDVIETDYENYALVSGAKDTSFVQIYSRIPNPGDDFIMKYKQYLGTLGYDPADIRDTPQDCEVMSMGQLSAMMAYPGMQQALTNTFPDLGLAKAVQFDPFTSVFETLKKLVQLYFS